MLALEVPVRVIWSGGVLAFGILLVAAVFLMLRREAIAARQWGNGDGSGRHLQRLRKLLRSIRSLTSIVVAEREADRLVEKACLSLVASYGYRMAWIGLVQEGSKHIQPAAQAGFEKGYLDLIEVTWDDSPTGRGPAGRSPNRAPKPPAKIQFPVDAMATCPTA